MTKNHPSKNQRETWTLSLQRQRYTGDQQAQGKMLDGKQKSAGETEGEAQCDTSLPGRGASRLASLLCHSHRARQGPPETRFFPKRTPRRCERLWRLFFFLGHMQVLTTMDYYLALRRNCGTAVWISLDHTALREASCGRPCIVGPCSWRDRNRYTYVGVDGGRGPTACGAEVSG